MTARRWPKCRHTCNRRSFVRLIVQKRETSSDRKVWLQLGRCSSGRETSPATVPDAAAKFDPESVYSPNETAGIIPFCFDRFAWVRTHSENRNPHSWRFLEIRWLHGTRFAIREASDIWTRLSGLKTAKNVRKGEPVNKKSFENESFCLSYSLGRKIYLQKRDCSIQLYAAIGSLRLSIWERIPILSDGHLNDRSQTVESFRSLIIRLMKDLLIWRGNLWRPFERPFKRHSNGIPIALWLIVIDHWPIGHIDMAQTVGSSCWNATKHRWASLLRQRSSQMEPDRFLTGSGYVLAHLIRWWISSIGGLRFCP